MTSWATIRFLNWVLGAIHLVGSKFVINWLVRENPVLKYEFQGLKTLKIKACFYLKLNYWTKASNKYKLDSSQFLKSGRVFRLLPFLNCLTSLGICQAPDFAKFYNIWQYLCKPIWLAKQYEFWLYIYYYILYTIYISIYMLYIANFLAKSEPDMYRAKWGARQKALPNFKRYSWTSDVNSIW